MSISVVAFCQNKKQTFSKNPKLKAKGEYFYVKFVDLDNSILSQKTIRQVKKRIFNLKNPHQNIYMFRDISEYNLEKKDIEKIVITYNKPINNTVPNFNFRSYKKRGYPEWQSIYNPGNFRYDQKKNYTETELSDWIVNHISILTSY